MIVAGIEALAGIIFILLGIILSLPIILVVSSLYLMSWVLLKFMVFFVFGIVIIFVYVTIMLLKGRPRRKPEIYNVLKKAIFVGILVLILPGIAWLTFRVVKLAATQLEFLIGIVFAILSFILLLPVIALMAVSYLFAEMLFDIDNPWLQLFMMMAGIGSIILLFKKVKFSLSLRRRKLEIAFMFREKQ